ncbi:hypothetical protein BG004_005340 [Podila humilis]|nr:hypothetical protein BG004_005340 [Podila humilis]
MRVPFEALVPVNRPSFSMSTVQQGNDVRDVLSQVVSSLNQGLPDNWERLMQAPVTQGDFSILMTLQSDLESIVRSWGLNDDMFEKAYHDINTMILLAVGEGVYFAQGLSYNVATCPNDAPRNLDKQELMDVQAVISTFQSDWALNLLSQQIRRSQSHALSSTSLSSSADDTESALLGFFDRLLRKFLGNFRETQDVLKVYHGGANNNETIEEWWKHAYFEYKGDPISLECEFSAQQRVKMLPPRKGCVTSTNVTTENSYSWVLVAPRDNGLFEVMFLNSELGVSFEECLPKEDEHKGPTDVLDSSMTSAPLHSKDHEFGSMVRWGHVDPNDGSFDSIRYLSVWKAYPSHVSKILLDFLGFSSASSYLKTPVYEKPLPTPGSLSRSPCPHRHPVLYRYQQQQLGLQKAVAPLSMDLSFKALMGSINVFAEALNMLSSLLGSSSSTTLQRRVCLGFDALDYMASSSVMQGVAQTIIADLVNDVVDLEDLPRRNDLKRLMTDFKYSTNFTWLAESMTFSNSNGDSNYFFFAKYGGEGPESLANIVYTSIKSKLTSRPTC